MNSRKESSAKAKKKKEKKYFLKESLCDRVLEEDMMQKILENFSTFPLFQLARLKKKFLVRWGLFQLNINRSNWKNVWKETDLSGFFCKTLITTIGLLEIILRNWSESNNTNNQTLNEIIRKFFRMYSKVSITK